MTSSRQRLLEELKALEVPTGRLNDLIINSYVNLVIKDKPNWIAVDSFIIEDLKAKKRRNSARKRSFLPLGWEETPNILIPVFARSHWSIIHVQLDQGKLRYYNSVNPSSKDIEAVNVSFSFFCVSFNS